MTQTDPATSKQMQFLWNLFQGAHQMNLAGHLDPQYQTEQGVTQAMQVGMNRQQCSALIEDLIFRVGAVPPGSLTTPQGQIKYASEKQCGLYRTLAGELAAAGDQSFQQYDMQGRPSWTVSKWISKMKDIKERSAQQGQPQWGQQGQQPQQQQGWQQPQQQQGYAQPQVVPQQAFQPQAQPPNQGVPQQQWPQQQQAAPAGGPVFDQYGNAIPQGADGGLPFE